jgi:intracellular multiplication protein IcmK
MDKAGPNARLPEIGAAVGSPAAGEIMAFLDGVPPQGAKPLLMQPAVAGVSAWEYAGRHYIRSPHAVRWPARVSVSHGTGGFDVYVVPATPAIVLSVDGQSQNMALSSKPTQLEVAQ